MSTNSGGVLKISNNVFLEKQELDRYTDFFNKKFDLSLIKKIGTFGIIKNLIQDPNFENFKIVAGVSSISFPANSYAVDSEGKVIYKSAETAIDISSLTESIWYWLKIAHKYVTYEEGTISINTNGELSGTGTKFLDVLRGQPNFPARIRFYGSTVNIGEYDVLEVLSDTQAQLIGDFTSESNLSYAVIGTFSPDYNPTISEKEIFQYNATELTFVTEVTPETAPAKTEGLEFYIARVKREGTVITVEDKRTEIWESIEYHSLRKIVSTNPLFGVEAIKWEYLTHPRHTNQVYIGWGLRSNSWTKIASLRQITITDGEGGKFKSGFITESFTDGDFNGWRIYYKSGKYNTIISSLIDGSSIKLTLDVMNPTDYTEGSDTVYIVPDVDFIQIKAISNSSATPLIEEIFSYPIQTAIGKLNLNVPVTSGTYNYLFQYRYEHNGHYSNWIFMPADEVQGYYIESSFDDSGELSESATRKTYTYSETTGNIELTVHPQNYKAIISTISDSGWQDITWSETDLSPIEELQYQPLQYRYKNGVIYLRGRAVFNLLHSATSNYVYHLRIPNIYIPTGLSGFSIGGLYAVLKADDPEGGASYPLAPDTDYCYIGFRDEHEGIMIDLGGTIPFHI